jgi:hypothetical protein
VQDLIRLLTDRAVDWDADTDTDLAWAIDASSMNVVVNAATRTVYDDELAAWEAARNLWQAILGLGHRLTDEGHSELGTIRRLDQDSGVPGWRGRVPMVLKSI